MKKIAIIKDLKTLNIRIKRILQKSKKSREIENDKEYFNQDFSTSQENRYFKNVFNFRNL